MNDDKSLYCKNLAEFTEEIRKIVDKTEPTEEIDTSIFDDDDD